MTKYLYLLLVFFISSCSSSPLMGIIINSDHHVYGNMRSQGLTSARIEKMGTSCSYSSYLGYLFILYYGKGNNIEEAKENGDISKVAIIDRSSFVIWPFFYKDCIVVWGE
jgi:hypothetical protein